MIICSITARRTCLLWLWILLCINFLPPAYAEKAVDNTVQVLNEREITQEDLENQVKALDVRSDLDEASKNKIVTFYRAAQDNLRAEQELDAQAQDYQDSIQQANEQLKRQQAKIEKFQAELAQKKPESFDNLSIDVLEQRLVLEKARLNDWDVQLVKLNTDLLKQENRPQEIRQETDLAKQALDNTAKDIETLRSSVNSELERAARELQLKTQTNKLTSELKALGVEAISYPARFQLLKAELQFVSLQKQALVPLISELEKALSAKRQLEAEKIQQELVQTEKSSLDKHKAVQALTKDNIAYSRELQTLTEKLEQSNLIKERLEAYTLDIETDFKSAERKISLAGLSPALGKILREQRRALDQQNPFGRDSKDVQAETAATSLAEFKIEDRSKQLEDIEAELKRLMEESVNGDTDMQQRQSVETELRLLLNDQKDLLTKLSQTYTVYLDSLGDYEFAMQQLVKQTRKYALYLDERLLWVPSSAPLNTSFFSSLYQSSVSLLSWASWQTVAEDLVKVMAEYLFLSLLASAGLVALFVYQRSAVSRIQMLSEKVSKLYTDDFRYTMQALGCGLLIVAPLPLILLFLGRCLSVDSNAVFSIAVGKGLQTAAVPLFFLQFFYRLFKPTGIVKKHFNWQDANVNLVYKQIRWLRFVVVPTVFLISFTGVLKNSSHSDSIGRLALIISLIAMTWGLAKILNLKSGLLSNLITQQPKSWTARLRYIWYPGAVFTPIVIIVFAAAGYYLSALELQQKLIITLRLIFIMVLIHQLVLRWLTVVDRQLALKNAQQKRKANNDNSTLNIEELLLDIPKINQQTIKMLEASIGLSLFIGFWMIWENILPAFSFLDQVVLWQHTEVIDKQETIQAITLTNLLLAGLYGFVMLIAVINFPGLMEVLVLRRLSVEAGSRYAINQLARYLLIAIGCVSIANELGCSWSQVQWLVAALTVGLGFGLQEIFANLISGIILLFERPIRIGDTVTIGNIDGKVSKIQMRATHIMDWDQKELIIPNKTFITDQLINWTLSDQVTRVVIPLGISYGSDVELAHKLISDTVRNTELILNDPEPSVYFVGFGESSLNFTIRFYVNELGHRLPVTHNLHIQLHRILAEHKISIPFPQRDIHIRSIRK